MILLCGIPSERPVRRVADELDELGLPYATVNQRRFEDVALDYEVSGEGVRGELRIGAARHRLEAFTGVYTRMMDARALPELRDEPPDSPRRQACEQLHRALQRWCELTPARVLNRTAAMATNASKPLQAQLIRRHAFATPETLITNDPELVRGFRARHGQVVFKSTSGVRSIVRELEDDDLERLELIRWSPTQFQRRVPGLNVRVHVVGREVFATAARTEATDYRYASRQGHEPAELEPYALEVDVERRCVALAADLGLPFAGIDLKLADGEPPTCFEVNPSPAFTYYEGHTGQPIARAVARLLAGHT